MKKTLLFLSAILLVSVLHAQQSDTVKSSPLTITEEMPRFPGGENAMMAFLVKNIRLPDANAHGTSYITFVVEKDGLLTGIQVLRGAPGCTVCDNEAMRVISSMPKWTPGKQNGEPVRVQFNLPIKFTSHR